MAQNGNASKPTVFLNYIFTFSTKGFRSALDSCPALAHIPGANLSDQSMIAIGHK